MRKGESQREYIDRLRVVLALFVHDPLLAWSASVYEENWQCTWCRAPGGDINDEPDGEHAADCPWTLAGIVLADHG